MEINFQLQKNESFFLFGFIHDGTPFFMFLFIFTVG